MTFEVEDCYSLTLVPESPEVVATGTVLLISPTAGAGAGVGEATTWATAIQKTSEVTENCMLKVIGV